MTSDRREEKTRSGSSLSPLSSSNSSQDTTSKKVDINLVPEPTETFLNTRQTVDYKIHRENLLNWLLQRGKNPQKYEGYSLKTVRPHLYRIDQFYRWVWDRENGYTKKVTHKHADEYTEQLARTDYSYAHKSNCKKALKILFKWKHHREGIDKWDSDITFSSEQHRPQDYLTREERSKIREASLEYGVVPNQDDLSKEEVDEWKSHLSQRFGKKKDEISQKEWDRANGWKIPSLVWVSLDAGLRPIEVEKAVTSWVDLENGRLRIPKEESSKNRENWDVALKDQTISILERWMEERANYEEYTEVDNIWLTRHNNPYQSSSLKYLLHRICDIADISVENRKMSWYSIRHSTGTYMTHEEDLGAAQAQLRHKSEQTTMKYDHAPVEERRNALNRME